MTHARHVASKVAADLKRVQRIYQINAPSDLEIAEYQQEIAMLLDKGYLGMVTYGFKRNGLWVVALKYQAIAGSLTGGSDDPGGIGRAQNIEGADFTSFLSYSSSWHGLAPAAQCAFEKSLPVRRVSGSEPDLENGAWVENRNYSSGELSVKRSMIRRD